MTEADKKKLAKITPERMAQVLDVLLAQTPLQEADQMRPVQGEVVSTLSKQDLCWMINRGHVVPIDRRVVRRIIELLDIAPY